MGFPQPLPEARADALPALWLRPAKPASVKKPRTPHVSWSCWRSRALPGEGTARDARLLFASGRGPTGETPFPPLFSVAAFSLLESPERAEEVELTERRPVDV